MTRKFSVIIVIAIVYVLAGILSNTSQIICPSRQITRFVLVRTMTAIFIRTYGRKHHDKISSNEVCPWQDSLLSAQLYPFLNLLLISQGWTLLINWVSERERNCTARCSSVMLQAYFFPES